MSNSHFQLLMLPLDFILGNKSITSNFMTTSALADMIEREFHSCQVILFLNLFFIIPGEAASFIRVQYREWSYWGRSYNWQQPQQSWKLTTGSTLRQSWQDGWRLISRHEWLCHTCLWGGSAKLTTGAFKIRVDHCLKWAMKFNEEKYESLCTRDSVSCTPVFIASSPVAKCGTMHMPMNRWIRCRQNNIHTGNIIQA